MLRENKLKDKFKIEILKKHIRIETSHLKLLQDSFLQVFNYIVIQPNFLSFPKLPGKTKKKLEMSEKLHVSPTAFTFSHATETESCCCKRNTLKF